MQILIHLVYDLSNPDMIEHALLALTQLSTMDSIAKILLSSMDDYQIRGTSQAWKRSPAIDFIIYVVKINN